MSGSCIALHFVQTAQNRYGLSVVSKEVYLLISGHHGHLGNEQSQDPNLILFTVSNPPPLFFLNKSGFLCVAPTVLELRHLPVSSSGVAGLKASATRPASLSTVKPSAALCGCTPAGEHLCEGPVGSCPRFVCDSCPVLPSNHCENTTANSTCKERVYFFL